MNGTRTTHRAMAAIAALAALNACDSPLAPAARRAPVAPLAVAPSEEAAIEIAATIRERHLPHGTIIDPVFASADPASPDYSTIVGYARAGDAAIWTGHWLAAESFRWKVTGDPEALADARAAVHAIRGLVDVTGTGALARFALPVTSPWVESVTAEEGAKHGRYEGTIDGVPHYWFDNTSRDQYSGVFFGLGVAYDMIDDAAVRAEVAGVVTRMLDYLLRNAWSVKRPDGTYSTTFLQRPDQQLAFLQVGRHVNPRRFALLYLAHRALLGAGVRAPIETECKDPHGSYYKFNLDHINLFHLVRLEPAASPYRALYLDAFAALRSPACTGAHPNAHFEAIDRALGGNAALDARIADHLGAWLDRPRRDYFVDWRPYPEKYPPCGEDRSCIAIAVEDQVNTDFLWQRSPFLLYGGGDGRRETAGIDYILPYWMARWAGASLAAPPALAAAAAEAALCARAELLRTIQHRGRQKRWLADHGFPLGAHAHLDTADDLAAAARALGPSLFVKATEGGYDGRSQFRFDGGDVDAGWRTLGGRPAVAEQALDLALELSVLVARRPSGEILVYPPALNHHERQILAWSILPADLDPAVVREAQSLARGIAEQFELEGILAVEMFLTRDGRLLVNELAPRPHNSYHASELACPTSQFEQLVRAVCDLPLGVVEPARPSAIVNLLGDLWQDGRVPDFASALQVEGTRLFLYGKRGARPGRKMGHLAAVGDTAQTALDRVQRAYARL